jgi:hypothetical protein
MHEKGGKRVRTTHNIVTNTPEGCIIYMWACRARTAQQTDTISKKTEIQSWLLKAAQGQNNKHIMLESWRSFCVTLTPLMPYHMTLLHQNTGEMTVTDSSSQGRATTVSS